MIWAMPITRVFEIDLEPGPNRGGEPKIIAAILEAPVIEKILTHLAAAGLRAAAGASARRLSLKVSAVRLAQGNACKPPIDAPWRAMPPQG